MDTTEPREESALQAAKAGRVKFLSHPCKKCGGRLRYTSSRQCIPCAIVRATAYQNEVREALHKVNGKRKRKVKASAFGKVKAFDLSKAESVAPATEALTTVETTTCEESKVKAVAEGTKPAPYNSIISSTTSTKEREEITKARVRVAKPESVSDEVWSEWIQHRQARRSLVTPNVLSTIEREAKLAGWTLEQALMESVMRGWQGFRAEWVKGRIAARNPSEVEYRDGNI